MLETRRPPIGRITRSNVATFDNYNAIRLLDERRDSGVGYELNIYNAHGYPIEQKIFLDAVRTILLFREVVKRNQHYQIILRDTYRYERGRTVPYSHIRTSEFEYDAAGHLVTCKHEELLKQGF